MKRDRAEAAIVVYIAKVLLSPEAIEIAKRAYQDAIREDLATREHERIKQPDTFQAEEAKLREMSKAGTLSPDIAQAALDALGNKRRRIAAARRASTLGSAETFSLGVERYQHAVQNLGRHVVDSEHSEEERSLVRELLGGHGIVFTRNGRIGARFESAGLLDMAEFAYKSMIYNFGSGGRI